MHGFFWSLDASERPDVLRAVVADVPADQAARLFLRTDG